MNTHIQNVKVWFKSVLPWLKYSIFSRGLFFYWRTLYILHLALKLLKCNSKFEFWVRYAAQE